MGEYRFEGRAAIVSNSYFGPTYCNPMFAIFPGLPTLRVVGLDVCGFNQSSTQGSSQSIYRDMMSKMKKHGDRQISACVTQDPSHDRALSLSLPLPTSNRHGTNRLHWDTLPTAQACHRDTQISYSTQHVGVFTMRGALRSQSPACAGQERYQSSI
ncbi:hypothetical protein N657DRAFT_110260 [Parathielavia appendiculata]|uniref:Uncharacterized protein n=1 Tax=Parathielavia appendiculata TaxID=2587402 RepID=A0AAN6TW32_9PEZI|nr:hypothetical protein N657DRAFT_110260 [Parathielavia appendiculata]